LRRGHRTSTAPHKAGNIAPIQGRASPWQEVKGDSVPFAEHETESRPERSSGQGAAQQQKQRETKYGLPTFLCGRTKNAAPSKPISPLAQERAKRFSVFFNAEPRRSRWSLAVVAGSSLRPATMPEGSAASLL